MKEHGLASSSLIQYQVSVEYHQFVWRRIKEYGIKTYRPAICFTLTEDHKRCRLAWCEERVRWNHNQWRNAIFTDEWRFYLNKKKNGKSKGVYLKEEIYSRQYDVLWQKRFLHSRGQSICGQNSHSFHPENWIHFSTGQY